MRLEEHISQLLFQHECVIVPNFGAFITNTASVKLDQETNTFIPPRKEVSFNSTLIKNDGVLINKIVHDEPMSFDNAQLFVSEQIYFWQEHLKNGKVLVLKNIGSLELNEAGKIDFKPDNHLNYFIPAYGLSNLKANYILEKQEHKTSNQYMSKLLIAASFIPIIIGGVLYFNTPKPVENFVTEQWSGLILPMIGEKQEVKESPKTIQYDVYNLPQTIEDPSLVEYQIAEIATTKDTIESPKKVEITVVKETKINDNEKEVTAIVKQKEVKKDIKTNKKEDAKKLEVEKKETSNKKIVNSNKKYQVIAASLKRQEDANRLLEDLKKQGYKNADISYVKGRYYYVTYNTFNDIEQAQKYMNEVNQKSPGTWVRTNQ
ncbi:SPOR domain-containing protein [Chishuiella sp.]|uniref:HU domain-containing protein n=1 Tax=Chishuiella sp. TaxID=1969467 RepID=UPI0028AA137B|nr:SPOR domain-containing protein [Chishuiella sp.]